MLRAFKKAWILRYLGLFLLVQGWADPIGVKVWADIIYETGSGSSLVIAQEGDHQIKATLPWAPGFKAGVDLTLDYDQWHVMLEYMYLVTGSKKTSGTSTYPYINIANQYTSRGQGSYSYQSSFDLSFKTLQLMLWRPFGPFRPKIGLIGSWQIESLSVSYDANTLNLRQNEWGVGPQIGCDAVFPYAFASISASMCWGRYRIRRTDTASSIRVINTENNFHSTVPVLYLAAGPRYSFGNFSLNAGFEGQAWIGQQKLRLGDADDTLSVYGAFIKAAYTF